jgi:uncharacterized protein
MKHSDTENKVALITGGSSGIGWAIACELAKRKYNLLLVSNQEQALIKCSNVIEEQYDVKCYTLYLDLADTSGAKAIFNYTEANNLTVVILVNNAGMLVFSEVVNTPLKKLESIMYLHMNTPTLLCNLFAAKMKQQGEGYVLNVSSISSVMPFPGISVYGPTKTYMHYFTKALRCEMKMYNVHVTCLIPGATATELYDPNKVNLKLAMKLGIMHTPEFVAKKAVKDLLNRKAESIPGWVNKLTLFFIPLVPTFIIEIIHQKSNLLNKGSEGLG